VGEATVPHLKLFNSVLEIDEVEFIREVRGTFKLGIQFVDWGRAGDRYIHGFGTIGHDYGLLPFHQYWLKLFLAGQATDIGRLLPEHRRCPAREIHVIRGNDVPATSPLANITMPITSTRVSMPSICAATPKRAACGAPKGRSWM